MREEEAHLIARLEEPEGAFKLSNLKMRFFYCNDKDLLSSARNFVARFGMQETGTNNR
jgi:hypothetical protein